MTTSSIRLLKRNNESNNIRLVFEWKIPLGELISGATSNFSECLLACRNQIYYFLIGDEKFEFQKYFIIKFVHLIIFNLIF